ncbi:hypothetical protein M427DRAFT_50883 [Gonapodya prolifera JEL478]|uniref:Thioredoxin-like fold domain-containing protein n=1 Tax=Gonapodya prolifera (strain JEL478) TaxID=1344416 RepID=A0A139B0S1_GONPJ|nr:hypothetical protein M427DRAFT_56955 [Gonapodya prolifera JEL478]KXS22591.1 hypothetical protein M427DRAFT_50883 [Gonapodya prolifera JEL478]|eukprot:KXS15049.1 hypothetical protein M427DRAFT_56955 [Gonapodya prolifera JEL478]
MSGYLTSLGIPSSPTLLDYVGAALFLGIPAVAIFEGVYGDITKEREQRDAEARRKKFPADTIILHQFPRPDNLPSSSIFCLKAETLLLFSNAVYENDLTPSTRGFPKGKLPAFSYNGKLFQDSQIGYSALVRGAFVKDVEEGLDEEVRARSAAFRALIEEQAWRVLLHERWLENRHKTVDSLLDKVPALIRSLVAWAIQNGVSQELHVTGISRHTPAERDAHLLPNLLDALSAQLGHHMWLLGTEEPTSADASLFAFLANAIYYKEGSPKVAAGIAERENLHNYFRRIREIHWSQWDATDPPEAHLAHLARGGVGAKSA